MATIFDRGNVIYLILDIFHVNSFIEYLQAQFTGPIPRKRRKKRSLVRKLSFLIPNYQAPRIYIQVIGANLTRKMNPHLDDSNSYCEPPASDTPHKDVYSFADIRILLEQCYPDSLVITRAAATRLGMEPPPFPINSTSHQLSKMIPPGGSNDQHGTAAMDTSTLCPRASTPLSYLEPSLSADPIAMVKINQLEEELAQLRKQIASIAAANQHSLLTFPEPFVNGSTYVEQTLVHSESLSSAPPPPPPPPPPSLFASSQTLSLKEQIEQNKKALKNVGSSNQLALPAKKIPPPADGRPDLSQILKGLNEVKLRPLVKSPGGTPIPRRRSQQEVDPTPSDPTKLLELALKRRFAQIHGHFSPGGSDKENSEPWDSPSTDDTIHISPSLRCRSRPSQQRTLFPLTEANA